jgi:hypothetical protein
MGIRPWERRGEEVRRVRKVRRRRARDALRRMDDD